MPSDTDDASLEGGSSPEAMVNVSEKKQELPPEEGLAGWLSIVGCSFGLFTTFGFLNA